MGELRFTPEEKQFVDKVIRKGLLLSPGAKAPQWLVMRLALAKSLNIDGFPEDSCFRAPPSVKGGSELHLTQVTGLGTERDYTDSVRLMLSVKHGADYFSDETAFIDALQRHLRRGLKELQASWRDNFDFHDYLLNDLYFRIKSSSEPGSTETGLTPEKLQDGLAQIGVSATLASEPQVGPRLTRFELTLETVDGYDRLRKSLDDLAFAMGLGTARISMHRGVQARQVRLDIPRPMATWKMIDWREVASAVNDAGGAMPVCPGTNVLGRPFVFDLAEAPHLFVAGTTGSGKSVCLNAIILSLLKHRKPPRLVLIDPKEVEFADYAGCKALLDDAVLTSAEAAEKTLRALVGEMQERQEQLRALNVRNISEAEAKGSSLERIVVVVDELADLLMQRETIEEPLVRLAQKARAVGIHLILATQRPEAKTFPGLLRSNVPSRIALTVQKAAESRIILDEAGAEGLLMRGDMLIRLAGKETERVHGVKVDREDVISAVRGARRP